MRDSCTRWTAAIGAGFMLAAVAVTAQQPDAAIDPADAIDALEPGVDTSAAESAPAVSDDVESAVAGPVLAAEVTRSQSGGQVMDRMDLGRTEITGNQELPKVLYIVPWKKADPGDLLGKPVNSLIDEVLAPIDREEFVRTVDYYDDLYGDDEG